MSAQVDTTTKLAYLLPTGTFLTFQVLAPLATNNGKCGPTEQILTAVTLALLVAGCIATCFTDSYVAPDGKVYNGFLTYKGLWLPGYGPPEMPDAAQASPEVKIRTTNKRNYIEGPMFKPLVTDYINAALSAIAFLTLTLFTDPVSTCFYPHLSGTILKTLPVLLATVLSFCCSFGTKIRHGYGNSISPSVPAPVAVSVAEVRDSSSIAGAVDPSGVHDLTKHRGDIGV